jgi:hypothetical protein
MRKWLVVPGSMAVSALLVVAGAASAATVGVPAHALALTWSVVHSPNRGASGNSFDGMSCASKSACTAVGSYLDGIGAQRTLAESWDGTRWSVLHSANRGRTGNGNALFGVSCALPRACMAVGASGLATGGASGLSGGSASGLSIDSLQTLAESWDGTRWSVLPSPNRGTTGDNFDSVSCVSADVCTAVGAFGNSSDVTRTLVESWDGAHWSVVPNPNPVAAGDGFRGVSCASTDACMAVGFSGSNNGPLATLTEFWNGSRWSVVPSPNPVSGSNEFNGVSCAGEDACTAVGVSGNSSGVTTTLIESWNGSRWSVVPSPNPGPGVTWLNGVSCAATDACNAAGYYFTKTGTPRTLIESWDGTRWSVVPTPSPGVENRALNGVSCASATTCTAAGDFFSHAQAAFRTLIETGTANG